MRLDDLKLTGQRVVYNFDTGVAWVMDAATPLNLQTHAKHEYFIVAPILANGMAVIGDTTKFVTMADQRIASVEASSQELRVDVTVNQDWNSIIVGYAEKSPASVESGGVKLEEVASPDRLRSAKSGWFYDPLARLWSVKIDFEGAARMETRTFTID